jgi:translation initiation factor 2A
VAAKLFANEVQFYPGDKVTTGTPESKIQLANVSSFALSPGKDLHVAVFVPEKKVNLASLEICIVLQGNCIGDSIATQYNFYSSCSN